MLDYTKIAKIACSDAYRADALNDGYRADNDCFVLEVSDRTLYIGIAGSGKQFEDWIENFDGTDSDGVARGFRRPAKKIYKEALRILGSLYTLEEIAKIEDVVVCGHSRGGSIALALVAMYPLLGLPNCAVTFGAPCVFHDEALRDRMRHVSVCFEHVRDVSIFYSAFAIHRNKTSIPIGKLWNPGHLSWFDILTFWRLIINYFRSAHSPVGYEIAARRHHQRLIKGLKNDSTAH